ncbi:hypothetical protein [Parasitella parasitica]|uniref:Mitochondrial cardiolipin hydrolase n=1 Tax=Parasitella parasitica TaxID=35722 RepID=A0A0B7N4Y8_9FUNG|nr:hypothetical protein [Parasitella parasitica]
MSENLPWDHDKPLSISQLLKQVCYMFESAKFDRLINAFINYKSMRSVDTIVSSNSLLDKMSVHLNGLLRQDEEPKVDKAVMLLNSMFANADRAMSSDSDKQVLAVLKRQVSSFIGVTLGVKQFLEQQEQQEQQHQDDDSDDDGKSNKLSWSAANEKESKCAWHEKKAYYDTRNGDIYGPEHAEHERLRRQQLEEEQFEQDTGSCEEENDQESSDEDDSDEYEEVVEQVQVKSREIGGAGGFQTVRRRQKKKKATTITTNFSYSHSSSSYDNNSAQYSSNSRPYYPRHHARITEFRPEYLQRLSADTFCMPFFFPSEESYGVFHAALSSAKEALYVCVFSLTDNETADVLIDAKKRGVDVRVITDNDQMDECKGADVLRLHEQFHIPFKKDNSDQFMHNKFAVIDGKIVITGSFNWSAGARYKNRENIIVTNIPSVVNSYTQEFKELWGSL